MARTRGAKDSSESTSLTPFADALEQWLFDQSAKTRRRWSRRTLAEAQDVSYGTVDGWFKSATSTRKAALPEPEAFWALVRVTGWTPEHLRQLIGYEALPPHVLGPWDFLRERAPGRFSDAGVLANVMRWIDDVQREYRELPKRPRTRHRKGLSEPVGASDAVDTTETAPKQRKEPAHAGK